MKNNKVLIVTYYWPPAGGAAVYRVTKFCKYLSRNGWEPVVLTVNESESSQQDDSLLKELPENIKVYKTRSFEPSQLINKISGSKNGGTPVGAVLQTSSKSFKSRILSFIRLNFFIPDAKIGWIPFAVSKGEEVIRNEQPSLIFSTSPPPTVHLIAKKLKEKTGLPWVADYRDPWTNIYYLQSDEKKTKAKIKNKKLETECLEAADALTVVNHGFFEDDFERKESLRITRITNGFDPEDYPASNSKKENDHFTIRYLGHFKNNQFPIALKEWLIQVSENQILREKVRLEFIGYTDPKNRAELQDPNIRIPIIFRDFVDREQAMDLMASSSALFMSIGGDQKNKYGLSLKLFDYLLHGKPILAFGPIDGDAAYILTETKAGKMFAYNDFEGVSTFLSELVDSPGDKAVDVSLRKPYSVPELTKRLIDVFEKLKQE